MAKCGQDFSHRLHRSHSIIPVANWGLGVDLAVGVNPDDQVSIGNFAA